MSKPVQIYLSSPGTYNFTNGSYNNTKLTTQSIIMLGNESISSSTATVSIILPLYNKLSTLSSNNGNGTIFYLYNQQPLGGRNLVFKNPSGMESFSLTLQPKERAVIGIMTQTYVLLNKMSGDTTSNSSSSPSATPSSSSSGATPSSSSSGGTSGSGTVPYYQIPGEPVNAPQY